MKFNCNGLDLSDALNKVTRAIPIKKLIPILEGVKISAYGNTITLFATDMDFAIEKKINAQIFIEGEVLVPGKLLCDIIKTLSNENEIEITYNGENKLNIKYQDNYMDIVVMDMDEYIPIKEDSFKKSFTLKEEEFKDIVKKTAYAVSVKDTFGPIYKGVHISLTNNRLTCAALDGSRLAERTICINSDISLNPFVVSAKYLNDISSLMENDENEIKISIAENKIMVDFDETKIIVSLLNGKFIDYKNSFISNIESEIVVDRKQLLECLERTVVISRSGKVNLIKIETKEGKLKIFAQNEMGYISETIPVFNKGKDVMKGLNSKYLIDCLKVIEDKFVKIKNGGNTEPIIITTSEEDEKDEFLNLILPVQ